MKHRTETPHTNQMLGQLQSDDRAQFAEAVKMFDRLGKKGAELLINKACSQRLAPESRIRLLMVAERIGVPFTPVNCDTLQKLMEDDLPDIVRITNRIASQTFGGGQSPALVLPFLSGRAFGGGRKHRPRTR